jgi:hypothetical protein
MQNIAEHKGYCKDMDLDCQAPIHGECVRLSEAGYATLEWHGFAEKSHKRIFRRIYGKKSRNGARPRTFAAIEEVKLSTGTHPKYL